MHDQRRQLGGEREETWAGDIEKRLFAKAVARGEQPAARTIPDDEREHAVQSRGEVLAPLLIAVDQDLGVGMVAAEDMTRGEKLGAQFCLVVDLAVEQDADRAILVPHRLMAAGDIDDGKSLEGEMHGVIAVDMKAGVVGAAVDDRVGHRRQVRLRA